MKVQAGKNLIELNEVQREAVESADGPVLVLAGAGSGKTRVLTSRIIHLLETKRAKPSEILAMTFTNKAAQEMKDRVRSSLGTDTLWIGTFHSIFSRILRMECDAVGYPRDFVIYDADDQERLIKHIMGELGLLPRQILPKSVSGAISRAKNNLTGPDTYSKAASNPFEETVARIYPEYESRLRAYHAFDFDDLLTMPIRLFANRPDILERYQKRFRYILVDEYQDTNRAQYVLLHELGKDHRNLFVVGDDDQSIYGWRGADIRNILEFEEDFDGCRVFRLEQNYRSTRNILAAASSVVENNKGRKGKRLWSEKEKGEKVTVIEVFDEREEALRMTEIIREEVFQNKRTFHDFALLYRTNAQSRVLEDALRRCGMSYIIVGGVRFYERKEIKDVLAYLKLIANPDDGVSLRRIVNFPLRGIGDASLERVEAWGRERELPLLEALSRAEEVPGLSSRVKQSMLGFVDLIRKYAALKEQISPNELVHTLVDETGLLLMYKEDTSIEGQNRADNIREFLSAVNEFVAGNDQPTLSGFLEEISLYTDIDRWDDRSNAITLMTLHCAKGLEFRVVFITGLEEGLFPVSRSLEDPHTLEEERRLFHVGITRAMEKVYILYARSRNRFNEQSYRLPSRFLTELDPAVVEFLRPFTGSPSYNGSVPFRRKEDGPDFDASQEVPDLRPGIWVEHELYGRGQIKQTEGRGKKQKVVVLFEGGIEKKFLSEFAHFTILNGSR